MLKLSEVNVSALNHVVFLDDISFLALEISARITRVRNSVIGRKNTAIKAMTGTFQPVSSI